MKDLIFRVWDKEKKVMLYNNFSLQPTTPTWGAFPIEHPEQELLDLVEEFQIKEYKKKGFSYPNTGNDYTFTDWANWYGLEHYEVMQYICMMDIIGNKVFEEDIIEGLHDFGPGGWMRSIGIIRWKGYGYEMQYWKDSEVIGNTFENPELKLCL